MKKNLRKLKYSIYRPIMERLIPCKRSKRLLAEEVELILNKNAFNKVWYLQQNVDVAAITIDPLVHYLTSGATEGRKPNALFDGNWYLEHNPDVAKAGVNPLVHYLSKGAAEGRKPNPLFDGRWYLEQNPDAAKAGVNPLVHYLNTGAAEGRSPHPIFDGRWYLQHNPDVAKAGINPLEHYLNEGAAEGKSPHPIFDGRWYLQHNPDVAKAGINPLEHYLNKGAAEGRQPNALFDGRWYLEQNPDVAKAGVNPLEHYLNKGAAEGKSPHPIFDGRWYLQRNPDVAKAGVNPLVHYLNTGAAEGRLPKENAICDLKILCEHLLKINKTPAIFDGRWYLQHNSDVAKAGINPLEHYLKKGAAEGRQPNALFDGSWYLEQNPDVAKADVNPLVHYFYKGADESRKPNPLFDGRWYLQQNPDVAKAGVNPLVHYLNTGAAEGRSPHPIFDGRWYLQHNSDVAKAGINPLEHYLKKGAAEGRQPNALFDGSWYLEQNPDVAKADVNPLVHYFYKGADEGRKPNPLFDGRWYLQQNPDVAKAGVNPLVHYLNTGAAEGRSPHPIFDGRWYLQNNPDVAKAGVNPLVHYLNTGAAEGRSPHPIFDGRWYLQNNPDVAKAGISPLVHFLNKGAAEGRQPKENSICDLKILCEHLLKINKKPVEQISFKAVAKPKISVIIPVYNQIHYTLQCLESICRYLPLNTFEVIIVDDCSTDDSAKKLSSIEGLTVISNKKNQGFIRSCNIGAQVALGEYVCFLNNDTEVTAGWLDELLITFNQFPGTGLVGSKLVYPDGTLQEAGGIIWQDGSAWNFGRNQNHKLPVYNYAREVDYCSGASIMVPKALFAELGGFDEHYLPAYCEDYDLALKIRDQGWRVIYQPLSVVIHYEGITSGTDLSQGTKAYQVTNLAKAYERWKSLLLTYQPNGMDLDIAKDRMATRRVLVMDSCTPSPDQDAGSLLTYNLMLLLREMDFQVTFIPEDNYLYLEKYTPSLQRVGIEVLYAPYITNINEHLTTCGDRYDLVLLFRPQVVERNLKAIRTFCPKAKVLFHTVDLHFLRMSREAALQSNNEKQIAANEMKLRELEIISTVDSTIVVSTAEFDLLKPELPNSKIHVFPLIIDVQNTTKAFNTRKGISFVGGFQHAPNVDAVVYFVKEIMPLLRKRIPDLLFYVVGSMVPAEIEVLASDDVIIVGFLEELNPLLDTIRVSIAPLRFGAGIKGKIGSAMAIGLPVVATTLAAEGMSVTNGENILVAENTEQFSDAVVKLYQDEALWNRISQNSMAFAENAWGAEVAWGNLAEILNDLDLHPIRSKRPLTLYKFLNS